MIWVQIMAEPARHRGQMRHRSDRRTALAVAVEAR
ncbi:hypothetical protein J2Y54_001471 [Sphingomonas sp. BE123]|nr:hypothetical protein [Sphingomonas sp. BE123]